MSFRPFRSAALPLAAAAVIACADPSGSSNPPLAAMMLGEWSHSRPSASSSTPVLNVGVFVSIAIDSAREMQFWGRVTRWFAGDMDITNHFGPVSGSLNAAYGVVLQIEVGSEPGVGTLRIEGEVQERFLMVNASWHDLQPGPFPQGSRFERLQ